ncbi:MAG: manganese efflux pump [Planctomycetes bacterium]|nr:manganese efflux pump [Planctomycetota bacterium]
MIALVSVLVSIGLDTFAVAIGLGVAQVPRRHWLRIGLTFAVFEGGMPIIGVLAGSWLSSSAARWPGIAAAVALIVIGALAIREAWADEAEDDHRSPPIAVWPLMLMGFSASLDEAAVGLSLGALGAQLGFAIVFIAAQAFMLTFLGLWLGRRLGAEFGERAEMAAGIILVLLGIALLVEQVGGAGALGGLLPSEAARAPFGRAVPFLG